MSWGFSLVGDSQLLNDGEIQLAGRGILKLRHQVSDQLHPPGVADVFVSGDFDSALLETLAAHVPPVRIRVVVMDEAERDKRKARQCCQENHESDRLAGEGFLSTAPSPLSNGVAALSAIFVPVLMHLSESRGGVGLC